MSSKLSLSFAIALALSIATAGVARANPIPTSTDEARALAGRTNTDTHVDADFQTNGPITSTDQARAQAGDQADCHALITFTHGQANLFLADDADPFWLVISALTGDSPAHRVVLGATEADLFATSVGEPVG